jgi:hypothetical protein
METVASQMRWPLVPSVTMTMGNMTLVKSHFGELEHAGAPTAAKRAPKIVPAAPDCMGKG